MARGCRLAASVFSVIVALAAPAVAQAAAPIELISAGGNGAFDACDLTIECLDFEASEDGSRAYFSTAERIAVADTDLSKDVYLNTAAGPVRTIMWGDHLSLQRDLRDPLRIYLGDAHAPAVALTMRPSRWVDPGGTADNRLERRPHPVRLAAHAIVGVGLLFWIWLPVQIAGLVVRRMHS